ncbi:unnamed protein product [Echinostoma caproni]|uniref:EF-hand domain-containing protein n=1 Tax=Echinostoma caproni TaxID=27848 RepID=A0A183AC63_9TREM|nr:unnamed protein product [Echinostoma caproni]
MVDTAHKSLALLSEITNLRNLHLEGITSNQLRSILVRLEDEGLVPFPDHLVSHYEENDTDSNAFISDELWDKLMQYLEQIREQITLSSLTAISKHKRERKSLTSRSRNLTAKDRKRMSFMRRGSTLLNETVSSLARKSIHITDEEPEEDLVVDNAVVPEEHAALSSSASTLSTISSGFALDLLIKSPQQIREDEIKKKYELEVNACKEMFNESMLLDEQTLRLQMFNAFLAENVHKIFRNLEQAQMDTEEGIGIPRDSFSWLHAQLMEQILKVTDGLPVEVRNKLENAVESLIGDLKTSADQHQMDVPNVEVKAGQMLAPEMMSSLTAAVRTIFKYRIDNLLKTSQLNDEARRLGDEEIKQAGRKLIIQVQEIGKNLKDELLQESLTPAVVCAAINHELENLCRTTQLQVKEETKQLIRRKKQRRPRMSAHDSATLRPYGHRASLMLQPVTPQELKNLHVRKPISVKDEIRPPIRFSLVEQYESFQPDSEELDSESMISVNDEEVERVMEMLRHFTDYGAEDMDILGQVFTALKRNSSIAPATISQTLREQYIKVVTQNKSRGHISPEELSSLSASSSSIPSIKSIDVVSVSSWKKEVSLDVNEVADKLENPSETFAPAAQAEDLLSQRRLPKPVPQTSGTNQLTKLPPKTMKSRQKKTHLSKSAKNAPNVTKPEAISFPTQILENVKEPEMLISKAQLLVISPTKSEPSFQKPSKLPKTPSAKHSSLSKSTLNSPAPARTSIDETAKITTTTISKEKHPTTDSSKRWEKKVEVVEPPVEDASFVTPLQTPAFFIADDNLKLSEPTLSRPVSIDSTKTEVSEDETLSKATNMPKKKSLKRQSTGREQTIYGTVELKQRQSVFQNDPEGRKMAAFLKSIREKINAEKGISPESDEFYENIRRNLITIATNMETNALPKLTMTEIPLFVHLPAEEQLTIYPDLSDILLRSATPIDLAPEPTELPCARTTDIGSTIEESTVRSPRFDQSVTHTHLPSPSISIRYSDNLLQVYTDREMGISVQGLELDKKERHSSIPFGRASSSKEDVTNVLHTMMEGVYTIGHVKIPCSPKSTDVVLPVGELVPSDMSPSRLALSVAESQKSSTSRRGQQQQQQQYDIVSGEVYVETSSGVSSFRSYLPELAIKIKQDPEKQHETKKEPKRKITKLPDLPKMHLKLPKLPSSSILPPGSRVVPRPSWIPCHEWSRMIGPRTRVVMRHNQPEEERRWIKKSELSHVSSSTLQSKCDLFHVLHTATISHKSRAFLSPIRGD